MGIVHVVLENHFFVLLRLADPFLLVPTAAVDGYAGAHTPILSGYRIYHNYIRPHEALEGKTPADVAGIKITGENKWLTLIQNAGAVSKVKS